MLAKGCRGSMSEVQSLIGIVLKGIGLAMGVVVVVMSIIDVADLSTYVLLLGIAVACLGLNALIETD